jgi:uncharacterized delta-60 repeat protein
MKNVILFLMICMPYFTMAQSPCALDNTFSGDGKIISDASRLAEHIIALPNGQSIVAYNAFGNGHVYLRRLQNDGSIDNTFGTAGKTTIQVASISTDIKDMHLYNNQIYCCGSTSTGTNTYPFFARLSIDGILDNSFGNGGINTNPQHYTYNSLVIEPGTGKILIGGMKDFDEIVVVCVHTSGYIDGNFGNLGETTFKTANAGEYYETRHINLDKDNKIVLTGKYYVTQGATFSKTFIARLNTNGAKDNTFDNDAIAYYNSAVGNYDEGRRIFVNTLNDYYVCGAVWKVNQDYDYSLMKVKNNAVLDNNFDLDGWKLYNIGGSSQEEYLLNGAMMPDGNILMSGNQGSGDTVYFCLLMVKPDGSMDNNFAPNGVYKHIFGANNNNSSSALALSNDGKIYLGGYTRTCANGTCGPLSSGIARYTGGQMPNAIVQAQENQKTISIYPTCVSQNQWISLDIDHLEKQSIEIVNLNGQSVSFELFQNKIKLLNTSQGIYFLKIKNKHDYQTVKILQL